MMKKLQDEVLHLLTEFEEQMEITKNKLPLTKKDQSETKRSDGRSLDPLA